MKIILTETVFSVTFFETARRLLFELRKTNWISNEDLVTKFTVEF